MLGPLLLLAAIATPVSTEAPALPSSIPVDKAARKAFPHANPLFVDEIAWVNRYVNHAITYQYDSGHYGLTDVWVSWPADRRGDCEDYALSKLAMLLVGKLRVVSIRTTDGKAEVGHVVLEVPLGDGESAILDNNFKNQLMTEQELVTKHGYSFQP
jgi:predicted transglutaminase-like cysteine proteinase